jgi:exodeoxyribonuclease X
MTDILALILDTETTGLKNPEPVEIAHISLRSLSTYSAGLLAEQHVQFCERYAVTGQIERGAFEIHGISAKDLIGKPHWTTFAIPRAEYIVGHKIEFDARVLGYPERKFICTAKLAKLLWPELPNHKLTTIVEQKFPEIGKRLTANAHGALVDCKLCLLILDAAMREFEGMESWEAIYELAGVFPKKKEVKIPEKMPFGRHKGIPFEQIPQDYLAWIINLSDASWEVKQAARQHYLGN